MKVMRYLIQREVIILPQNEEGDWQLSIPSDKRVQEQRIIGGTRYE